MFLPFSPSLLVQNVVERHSVAMSSSLLGMEAHRGADGRYYSPFGILDFWWLDLFDLRVLPRAAVFVLILTFIA